MIQAEVPIIVPINAFRALIIGGGLGLSALLFVGFFVLLMWSGPKDAPNFALLLIGIICALIAVFLIRLSIAKPVALRMDSHGISGYYADAARWADIKRVGFWEDSNEIKHLGFELHDPKQFFDTQSPWRRWITWSNGRRVGYHITLPNTIFAGRDIEELAQIAGQLHRDATEA